MLYLVMTYPKNHKSRAYQIYKTWGSRCTYVEFLTSESDPEIPTLLSPAEDNYNLVWAKTKHGFKTAYEKYHDKVDWVMKADDDTYVIVENLRYLLSSYNHSDPIWFGCEFKVIVEDGYMSGGAGYVLSKEAVRRFHDLALTNASLCHQGDGGAEDAEMGKCMMNVGVKSVDARAYFGRFRFLSFTPDNNLHQKEWNYQDF